MDTDKISELLTQIGSPSPDGKWHVLTTISVVKKVRSGKRKGQVLVDESSIWQDLEPQVYMQLVKLLRNKG